jgi:SNF2 family DNA or RNA helicase
MPGAIKVDGKRGVILGLTEELRKSLPDRLQTVTTNKGNVLWFDPTRHSLDYLAHNGFSFDGGCRSAWAHFYKTRPEQEPTLLQFKTEPRDYQLEWFHRVKNKEYFAFEWEMGLGKTKVVLDIAAHKYQQGEIDGILVFSLSDVYDNWPLREVPKHMAVPLEARPWMTNRVEGGMRGLLDHDGLILAAMNFEASRAKRGNEFCQQFATSRKMMLVNDESHNLGNMSKQTKAIISIADQAACRVNMTGTPVPRDPLNIYPQYRILSEDIFNGKDEWQYKNRYAVMKKMPWLVEGKKDKQGRPLKPPSVVVGFKNQDELFGKISPHRSRLLKKDVLSLPEKIYMPDFEFDLSKEQRKAYNDMVEDLRAEFGEQRMTAANALVVLMRLQQISNGFFVDDDADPFPVLTGIPIGKKNPRIESMLKWRESVQGSCIIWATFRYSLNEVAQRLRKEGRNVIEYHGGVPKPERPALVDLFENSDEPMDLVASPATAGVGLTLLKGRDHLFYNNSYRWDHRVQAEDRSHRIGQENPVTYTNLTARDTVDLKILDAHATKSGIASVLTGDSLSSFLRFV